MKKFDVILTIWISLVLNAAMSAALPVFAMGFVNLEIFLRGFAIAFTVSTIFVFAVPVVKWGEMFAAACGARPRTVPAQMLSTVVLALILGTGMTLLMTLVNAGYGPHFIPAWLSCYPKALVTIYFSALAGLWTGIPIAGQICRVVESKRPFQE
jgi:hypothetical protein